MTEAATEAANSLGDLAKYVQNYESSITAIPGQDFADVQKRKSKVAAAVQYAWDHRAAIEEIVKFVQKQYNALTKVRKDQREALAKQADEAGDWPDFEKL